MKGEIVTAWDLFAFTRNDAINLSWHFSPIDHIFPANQNVFWPQTSPYYGHRVRITWQLFEAYKYLHYSRLILQFSPSGRVRRSRSPIFAWLSVTSTIDFIYIDLFFGRFFYWANICVKKARLQFQFSLHHLTRRGSSVSFSPTENIKDAITSAFPK